jgi:SAM-dependent methyltransferase
MELDAFRLLMTAEGQSALTRAAALGPTEATFLTCFDAVRKHHPPTLAKAALETALLRSRARDKFTDADRMYFTREALEQATGEAVARHRANRFARFGSVADLCCGIGGDALALAAAGTTVHAVDTDPLRVAMTEANAAALGLADRVRCQVGDALTVPLPNVESAFADPARRADGRRYLDPEDYTPPLSALRARFSADFPLAVKIAPGVAQGQIRGPETEVEFVSLGGELKECVLWFGPLRTTARRASVLPSGETLCSDEVTEVRPHAEPRAFLYDPDPAVTRAGLVPVLADRLSGHPLDPQVQLLTADRCIPTKFATAFEIEHVAPFHIKLLRDHLHRAAVGRITVIKRGSPADADDLLRKLKLAGPNHRTVVLTRIDGWHAMIVCRRLG